MNTQPWLFVSDVDDTLLGDEAALLVLGERLRAAPHITVVYNSSRPCVSLRQTLAQTSAMPVPDYLIGALGTEIEVGATGEPLSDYQAHLRQGWRREQIDAMMKGLGLVPHAELYQTPFKASYDVPDEAAVAQARRLLETAVLPAKLIFSGGKNLDVIPQTAGKGAVIQFLHNRLGLLADHVVVAGDSGNDVDMFIPPFRGVIVGNADADLRRLAGPHAYQARAHYAAGVLEGLQHWGVLA
jgi:sucrose-6-phosphatase